MRKHYKAREESSLLELRTFNILAMDNHVSTAIQPFAVVTASVEAWRHESLTPQQFSINTDPL